MLNATYWDNRYNNNQIQWDIHKISTPLRHYFDQLSNKQQRILIPGCGNAHEAAYLFNQGFYNVYICDWAEAPLRSFKRDHSHFPKEQIIHANFFDLDLPLFDLIIEQTFFCALDPSLRTEYAKKTASLLKKGGKVVGLLFNRAFDKQGPPFGGKMEEYKSLFEPFFEQVDLQLCHNSIPPRDGSELFIKLVK